MSCHFMLPFSVWLWGDEVSKHASLTKAKTFLKKEKIWSPNDEWKGYLKTWNQ